MFDLLIKRDTLEKVYTITNKITTIGRDSQNDIVINEGYISRQHCVIIRENNHLFVEDIGSMNGTFVNNKRIKSNEKIELKVGDIICFSLDCKIQIIVLSSQQRNINKNLDLSKDIIKIGRNEDNDIVIKDSYVSRYHAKIERINNEYYITDTSTNGTYINGKLITGKTKINPNDNIKIGNYTYTLNELLGKKFIEKVNIEKNVLELLKNKTRVTIGRAPDNDLQIDDPRVSRHHAYIEKINNKYYITDLDSLNGTYVNGNRIKGKKEIFENDIIVVGLHSFFLKGTIQDISNEVAIKAVNIEKEYIPGKKALHKTTFNIPHKSFVALMGPSGCGKSTLLKALNGDNPPTNGNVYIYGLEFKKNYNLIKNNIGYVPQDDIVHKELTVYEALYFAAKLRLPQNTSEKEIEERINEVLSYLNLNSNDLKNRQIGHLSGGQRKRVSIAVELISKPTILFLDEPTSPLDPETIDEFLTTIRKLTDLDMTVIMVTHKPEDLQYVDRVIFMAAGGYMVYYGDKNDILSYFRCSKITEIYNKFNGQNKQEILYYYQKLLSEKSEAKQINNYKIFREKSDSWWHQFYYLSLRYLKIKFSDKLNMALILSQPIVIALLILFIYKYLEIGVLFIMSISAIWFGITNASKEIVSEKEIYKRERMVNLRISTYVASKILILALFSLIQIILFVMIIYMGFKENEIALYKPFKQILFLFYISFSAILLGLLISSIFSTSEKVTTFVPLILIPQLVLAGIIAPIDNKFKEVLSYFTLSRWGTEGLAWIQNSNEDYKKYIDDSILIKKDNKIIGKPVITKIVNSEVAYYEIINDTLPIYDTIPYEVLLSSIKHESVNASVINYHTCSNDTLLYKVKDKKLDILIIEKGKKIVKVDPIKNLGFYEDELIGLFKGLENNYLALHIINFITLITLLLVLKSKDTL